MEPTYAYYGFPLINVTVSQVDKPCVSHIYLFGSLLVAAKVTASMAGICRNNKIVDSKGEHPTH